MARTAHAAKETHEFSNGVQALGEGVLELKDNITDLGHGAVDTMRAGVHEAKATVARTAKALRGKGEEASEALRAGIAERPLTSVGIAVGIGFLLGMFMRRPR